MMDRQLVIDIIEELENYRSSMHYSGLFGDTKPKGQNKMDFQKNLERVINQTKAHLNSMR